jgi:S1-C subfamily serine protease
VDAAGIARVLQIVEPVVTALAESTEGVPFTRVAAEKETSPTPARGFRVYVGGVPDYSHEGPGVRFTGVSPGSPAEQAGIQAGDVLLRFDSREVRDIYDYTRLLGERKPGDRVEAVVRRASGEVTLTLTLAARPGSSR